MANNSINSTTQVYLDIFDITNDLVVMKDGSASIILTVNALNFGLLAEEEQDAIIYSYASLLNSINYSIEILIKSQTKDVTNYLQLLKDREETAQSRLQAQQIGRYREFVTNLIQERNVLDKKFYVVITATPIEMGVMSAQSVVPGVKSPDVSTLDRSIVLERAKNNLEPKRDHLIAQFGRIGLYSRQLQTQEIIQLFYTSYNPEAAEGQQLTDSRNYTTPLVQASVTGENMTDQPVIMPTQTAPAAPQPMPAPVSTIPAAQPTPAAPSADEVVAAMAQPTQPAPVAPVAPAIPTPAQAASIQAEIDKTVQQLGSPTPAPQMSGSTQVPVATPTPVIPTPSVTSTPAVNANPPVLPEI